MGWKYFKEKFNITHHVQITKEGLCIGSGYVHDLIVVNLKTGELIENNTFRGFLKEEYPQLAKVSAADILSTIKEKDSFIKNLPVFTFEGSNIIEEYAEAYGYPNVTHSGKLMHDNVFLKNKNEAIQKAKK